MGSLSQRLTRQLNGLKGLEEKIIEIKNYLTEVSRILKNFHFCDTDETNDAGCFQVEEDTMPMNHQIFYQLQDIFNLLPDITKQSFVESMHVKTNDQMLVSEKKIIGRPMLFYNTISYNTSLNRWSM